LIACFVAPFFAGVPAFFDDRRETRNRGIVAMSIGLGIVYGIVLANLNSARPHIGSSGGMHGVLIHDWFPVIVYGIYPCGVLLLCLYFYERVAGDLWAMIRGFRGGIGDGDRNAA
jgi:hypothetical protein